MINNTKNIISIAQKEFADHVSSPRLLIFVATFSLIVFVFAYQKGLEAQYTQRIFSIDPALRGFEGIARIIGSFAPLIGIALGFDTMVKEIKSGSLNVLLTHPVFRDNIIVGKLAGSALALALVLIISVIVSMGTMLMLSGIPIKDSDILRIGIFIILTFFYVLVFLGIGVVTSILVKSSSDSLIYNIAIWLFSILFSSVVFAGIYVSTGQTPEESLGFATELMGIAPSHHYAQLTIGKNDIGWGGFLGGDSKIQGIFDTRFTLSQWLGEFWMNLIVLIVVPIILLIIAFITFLRKDIST
ncbi:ABC transporter permease [Candidatus Methanoperedens nitratireducens]|uniref:ABC-type transport system involved in multi-copper enzyme maturation, permease component n=1 Tax=Candidatus Methanoperedens nitratireducens TaxID=1392998 RepID=A0A284VI81_9EURY|nr:ABC transporter permease [Candidatus Methanoperedens nitroreducens]SNQ58970.1 conserved membrane hypothetical protein [Candidatus Methanoperedens nitroreducens]